MKVFVTGADGFIGSHLVEQLVDQGFEVTAFCLYNSFGSCGWIDNIPKEKKKFVRVLLDDINDLFFKIDSVVERYNAPFKI